MLDMLILALKSKPVSEGVRLEVKLGMTEKTCFALSLLPLVIYALTALF